jgi:glycosyltransferase involved in cell wall biosynthesis
LRRFLKKLQRRQTSETHRLALLSHFTRDLPAIRAALFGNRNVALFVVKHVGPGASKRDALHRFVYRRIDRLLAVSEYIRAKCERVYPIQPERTSVWHPGVDVARFAFDAESRRRLRREASRDDDDLILGYLGRITPNKGFEDLLDAATRLRAMFPTLHLWIGGSSSEGERWYEDGLRSRVSSLGLSDSVRFCGWQERGEEFLSAIDLFVVPSRHEAFGLTTVEAMACARPVVGFRAAGTAEIVEDGETGLLADPSGETAANLTQGIQQLLRNPQRLQALGDRGRQRTMEVFSHNAMMARLHAEFSAE